MGLVEHTVTSSTYCLKRKRPAFLQVTVGLFLKVNSEYEEIGFFSRYTTFELCH